MPQLVMHASLYLGSYNSNNRATGSKVAQFPGLAMVSATLTTATLTTHLPDPAEISQVKDVMELCRCG